MGLREQLEEALTLQQHYSSKNTSEMERRGLIIRTEIPDWLAENVIPLANVGWDLSAEGSDATGSKSWVPWARIYNADLSPTAQFGWYVVYLFRPDGKGVSLCISHSSTHGAEFRRRSKDEAARLVAWAQEEIGQDAHDSGMSYGLSLESKKGLAPAYEATTPFSRPYFRGSIPDDQALLADCQAALSLLAKLYERVLKGEGPEGISPELVEAVAAVEAIARPGSNPRSGGQGWGLSAKERKLVEDRAMTIAKEWLTNHHFTSKDVHKSRPYDFEAKKNGQKYVVEVKGTTGPPNSILLTKNEVALHRSSHPLNILLIVHGIKLVDDRSRAIEGEMRCIEPWEINDEHLVALSYQYGLSGH